MTLVDPTSAAGYAFGAKLPAADMTTIATQQPDAVDGVNGGTYAGDFTLNGTITMGLVFTLTATTLAYPQAIGAGQQHESSNNNWWEITDDGTYGMVWLQANITGSRQIVIPFTNLPRGGELKTVSCYIDGGSAHGALPANLPVLTVYSRLISTGVVTSIGTVTDAPADVTAYEAYHILGAVGGATPLTVTASHSHDGTKEFFAVIDGESGGNSAADELMIVALSVSLECTSIAPG